MISVNVIADSITAKVPRLTTIVARYPRFIHAEVMTYRQWSRCVSSSRAVPAAKLIEEAEFRYAMPVRWGKNQAGMSAKEDLPLEVAAECAEEWHRARLASINVAKRLVALGLHKQLINRLLEPYTHITAVITGIDASYANFFHQRLDPEHVEDNMYELARTLQVAYDKSTPTIIQDTQWHTPFVSLEEGLDQETALKASVARCARVSYLNHDGTMPDIAKDVALYNRLLESGHFSPFEHQAQPYFYHHPEQNGNLNGWLQNRKTLPNEYWTKPHV